MRRTSCSACQHGELRTILDLGESPVADAYADVPDAEVDRYPLVVAVCPRCWLVQLLDVLPQDVLFGTGYSFYSSASPPLSRYHETYARDVIRAGDRDDPVLAVEVGCNDGDFLRHLASAGWQTLGVDPAGGPVKIARERGLDVLNEPFGLDVARRITGERGRADVVVANHVLAHVENVSDVLAGMSYLLTPNGTAYVEVQYLPDLLLSNAYDLVYHEHRNFFSLSSLEHAARRHGLMVVTTTQTNRQGGSLRVTLRRDDGISMPSRVRELRTSEEWLRGEDAYVGLQARVRRLRDRLRRLVRDEHDAGRRLIGYGAPAKATTLLNFCGIDREWLECVVDTTVAKQGRYVPGTGIPVVAPDVITLDETMTALLLAWNYQSTIIRNEGLRCRWIVPVPVPTMI